MKTEAVYTSGQRLPVTTLSDADGLVAQNTMSGVVSVEYPFAEGAQANVQLFARGIFNRNPDLFAAPAFDPGGSLQVSSKAFDDRLEAEILGITSFKDQGWMARFLLMWSFRKDLRLGYRCRRLRRSGDRLLRAVRQEPAVHRRAPLHVLDGPSGSWRVRPRRCFSAGVPACDTATGASAPATPAALALRLHSAV